LPSAADLDRFEAIRARLAEGNAEALGDVRCELGMRKGDSQRLGRGPIDGPAQ
jgi:hypothetical protein